MDTYGLLGEKLGHSFSPKIHNKIFEYTDIKGEYFLLPTKKEDVPQLMEKIRSGEIKGMSVTIPYKLEVMKYLDAISEEAKNIQAVNTICMSDGKLTGYNTDCLGFEKTLLVNKIDAENKNIAVLGTGGASKAIVYVFEKLNAKNIHLFSRMPAGEQKSYDALDEDHDYDIIVNTTPVGMYPNVDKSPIKKENMGKAEAVIDAIYNPALTKLLSYAKDLGKIYVNGMYMLAAQAVKAQEIFNDIKIEDDITNKVYEDIIGELDE
ncbi:MAG: shikimate dehydrogenase [Eubacteriales bacterium]